MSLEASFIAVVGNVLKEVCTQREDGRLCSTVVGMVMVSGKPTTLFIIASSHSSSTRGGYNGQQSPY